MSHKSQPIECLLNAIAAGIRYAVVVVVVAISSATNYELGSSG